MTVLTNDQVDDVLARLSKGDRPTHLAAEFGVSYQSIYRIREGVRTTAPRKARRSFDTPLFERYSETGGGCWIYAGYINRDGYAVTNGIPVHRLFYEEHVGVIPAGKQLDHICSNRSCVNPAHLEPVTQSENLARAGFGRSHRAAA